MSEKNLLAWWDTAKNRKEWYLLRSPQMLRLLIVLIGGIFILVCAGNLVSPSETVSGEGAGGETEVAAPEGTAGLAAAERDLERRLEAILSSVAGSGAVQVTVTMAAGPEHIYAKNLSKQNRTTEERDQAGGNRITTEVNEDGNLVLVQSVSGGKEEPVLIRTTRPEIAGVLVLAEGADNPALREELSRAVETVLAIPPHKVTVLPKEGR
ncbi:hypothetical protein [Thermacetogenium phaeum]|uniref:Stage III sporulation protein AG n=1 Tax=Thermacetogenium phaeum TaxID=85874 RepID=A0A101FG02_9THEO|nr:hypothetical protein [Thermacetogenium phaeum]KUK36352.1 MAG: Stage III sporulation protein AG [Thermacetogenium phaeum]